MSINVGVIGVGGIAAHHLIGLKRIPEIGTIILCDPSLDALNKQKGIFPEIRLTTSPDDIFNDPSVTLVDICTPHYLHHPLAMRAFAAGKNVLCEKPIAITMADALEMRDTAQKRGLKFFISLNQMFVPAHRRAGEMIRSGALGKITMGVWKMIGNELTALNLPSHWKGDLDKAGGGAVFDTGTHAAYIMLDLLGPVHQVSAFTRRLVVAPANKGDDNSVSIIEFESGAVVSYVQTYSQTSEDWNERKYIYGSTGSLHLNDSDVPGSVPLRYFTPDCHAGVPVEVPNLTPLFPNTVAASVEHHVRCLIDGTEPLYDTQLAIDALQLVLALYESSEKGVAVKIYRH